MKKLFFLFAFLSSVAVTAQNQVMLRNNSSIDLYFNMYMDVSGACNSVTNITYFVAANSASLITAPPSEEFIFSEISPTSYCFGLSVSTSMQCVSTCPGYSSFFDVTNSSCAGGFPTSEARWTDCAPGGTGLITVVDY